MGLTHVPATLIGSAQLGQFSIDLVQAGSLPQLFWKAGVSTVPMANCFVGPDTAAQLRQLADLCDCTLAHWGGA